MERQPALRLTLAALLFLGCATLSGLAISQTQPTPARGFEVATVKHQPGPANSIGIEALPGGRLAVEFSSLRELIQVAYSVQARQISGGPDWVRTDRYDIQAKAEGNPPREPIAGPMLQVLLEERFHLVLHRETKRLPVYELTIGRTSAKLQPSRSDSCGSTQNPCGFHGFGVDGLNRTLKMAGATMAELAEALSRSQRTTVIDRTGLQGTFDLNIAWSVDPPSPIADSASASGPSIFTALLEQLGLFLKSTRAPVEVLVIDRVEKPSAN
jgi:uncharacterized protein (TIGR03435 family)